MKSTGISTDQLIYWGLFILIAITATQLLLSFISLSTSETNQFVTQTAIDRAAQKRTMVVIQTTQGDITFKLLSRVAPTTVNNFVAFAQSDFYVGTKFHRVVKDLLIQGGDPLSREKEKSLYGTGGPGFVYQDEIVGLPMEKGVVAMANRGKPNTNGSQFFIVIDPENAKELEGKYTIFGQVEAGMDVVERIASVSSDIDEIPLEDIVIKRVVLR
jgi:cyclophilin family peptidyl-prolyl cis-trans isomerase